MTLAVTIIFMVLLPGLRFENIPGKLELPPHDPLRRDLDEFQSKFGSGEIIIVGTELRHPLTVPTIRLLQRLGFELKAIEGVRQVHSLTEAKEVLSFLGSDIFKTPQLLQATNQAGDSALIRLIQELSHHPLYRNNFYPSMADMLLLLVLDPGFEHGKKGLQPLKRLLGEIREITRPFEAQGISFHLAGPPVLNVALNNTMRRDLRLFASISIISFLVILVFVFRSFQAVFYAILTALMALVWSVGLMPLTNTPMSLGLSMMIPLVLALALVPARFIPTSYFGGLSALIIVVAALADNTSSSHYIYFTQPLLVMLELV